MSFFENTKFVVQVNAVIEALKFLKRQTYVDNLEHALSLIGFKDLSEEENEIVNLIVEVTRAKLDGNLEPDLDIVDIYESIDVNYVLDSEKK